jgi:dTMP kinase
MRPGQRPAQRPGPDGSSGTDRRVRPTTRGPLDLTGLPALRAILRIRPFRRLWLVLGVASLGDWLGLLATSTFAAAQVNGAAAKGVAFGSVIAVRLLPAVALGPIAGVLADRFDRRYTMVVCDLLRFVLFASIPAAVLVTDEPAAIIGWAAVATFAIEAITMAWLPAKDAAVPNLLPRARLETANQLTLVTTYGITPVVAALALAGITQAFGPVYHATGATIFNPTSFSLYFLALTRLATAGVVFFGIREISGHNGGRRQTPGVIREFIDGWTYVGRTPLVRGLVLGILAAFSGGGMVVGTAQFYAKSLGGGDSTFYILFAMLFVGLAVGIVAGPRMIGGLSRRRWFGMSIVLAGASTALLAFAWHLTIAVFCTLLVGIGAGMAFLSGTTLLGREVRDGVRGRVFGFINMSTRVVLMLAISVSSVLVGLGSSRELAMADLRVPVSTTRVLLLAAGLVGVLAGVLAFRQMDDKPGVPVVKDLIGSLRGRPLTVPELGSRAGVFVVFEGGEGAGKSTQVDLLADRLAAGGHEVLVTREPGATEVGRSIRSLLLDRQSPAAQGILLTPRAEALLYAADRAHHVASVVRPGLARGAVVLCDRYIDSSLAYQGAGRTLPVEEVSWLSAWATGGLRPDLVVLLDIDPAVGLRRVGGRGDADRLEAESVAFHERVRFAFLDRSAQEPQRYLVIDATLPPDEIAEQVSRRVAQLLPSPPVRSDGPPAAGGDSAGGRPERVPAPPPLPHDPDGLRRPRMARANGSKPKVSRTRPSNVDSRV